MDKIEEMSMYIENIDIYMRKIYKIANKILETDKDKLEKKTIDSTSSQDNKEIKKNVPISIENLKKEIALDISDDLKVFLEHNEIISLDDVRKSGGLSKIYGTGKFADDAAYKTLTAHASLSLLSTDLNINQRLIDKGFTNALDIQKKTKKEFIGSVKGLLPENEADTLYRKSIAHNRQLINQLTEKFVSGKGSGPYQAGECECLDCEAATSPLAYLADLLDYCVDHIQITPQGQSTAAKVDLEKLESAFKQPLTTLPATCEAAHEKVAQVRMCLEVLMKYLQDHHQEQLAQPAKQAYLTDIYRLLLSRIGTSEQEIASLQNIADPEEQSAALKDWSARLGLPTDERILLRLNHLKLNTNSTREMVGLHEKSLESLFGLKGIEREPFANGVILADEHNQIQNIRLEGASWSINTDTGGRLYGNLKLDTGGVLMELFKEPSRKLQSLVCSGQISTVQGTVALEEKNYSGLSGSLTVLYMRNSKFEVTAVPEFLSWRLEALRQSWKALDLPDEDHSDRSDDYPAVIIDPDLIGPDDFRKLLPKSGVNATEQPFELWLRRRKWVDGQLSALESIIKPDGKPDLKTLIAKMTAPIDNYPGAGVEPPWKMQLENGDAIDLETLYQDLEQGDKETYQNTCQIIKTNLNLIPDAFKYVMRIKLKDDNQEDVSPAEWQDVYAILIRAMKTSLYQCWRDEEKKIEFISKCELLSPTFFWISNREPSEGAWPPVHLCSYPLMDPENVKFQSLPKHFQGTAGKAIWEKREALLARQYELIKSKRETDGLEAAIKDAIGHPNPGAAPRYALDTLLVDLNGEDAPKRDEAKKRIVNDLCMSIESFVLLMDVRARDAAINSEHPPREAEWSTVYHILKQAYVQKRLYDEWKIEEHRIPIIDADVADENDLPEQTAGEKALSWLAERRKKINEEHKTLWTKRKNGIDAVLQDASVQADRLKLREWKDGLNDKDPEKAYQAKVSIWENLKIPMDDFVQLMALIPPDDGNSEKVLPTLAEWKQIVSILTEIKKNKVLHPVWHEEEKSNLSEYWKLQKARLPRWRADIDQRALWQQALRQRSGPAVIDPDVFGLELLRFTIKEDAKAGAFRLHANRAGALNMIRRLLRNGYEQAKSNGTGAKWIKERLQNDDLSNHGVVTIHALGLSDREIEDIEKEKLSGKDLITRSAQLGLTPYALSNLVDAYKLAEKGAGSDEVWNGFFDTLLEAEKICWRNPVWRQEERNNDIVLGPDHFILEADESPTNDNASRLSDGYAQRLWRQKYIDFQRKLKGRIQQELSVIDSVRTAVNAAEEAVFPQYRNQILQVYGDHGISSGDPATWITQHLLIDAATGGCQRTTRVGQAIETLQSLLWQSRTGQFVDGDGGEYVVDADHFDDDWQWIGSYATWRAAMFVYLYPENLLMPTLRRWQTPAFRELAQQLQSASTLTSRDACKLAESYSDYFRDICNLTLEATCSAEFNAEPVACDRPTNIREDSRDAFLMFARSSTSNIVYWCAIDPQDKSLMGTTPWQPVPNLENVLNIIGAAPYEISEESRCVYLFIRSEEEDTQKLVYTRLDLTQGFYNPAWDTEPSELALPNDSDHFSAVIQQTNNCDKPPYIAVRIDNGAIYGRRLNADGDDWEARQWCELADETKGSEFIEILSMVESGPNGFYLFTRDTLGQTHYRIGLSSGPAVSACGNSNIYLSIRNTENQLLCRKLERNQVWGGSGLLTWTNWFVVDNDYSDGLSDPGSVSWLSTGNCGDQTENLRLYVRSKNEQGIDCKSGQGLEWSSSNFPIFDHNNVVGCPAGGLASVPFPVYNKESPDDAKSTILFGRSASNWALFYHDDTGWHLIDNTRLSSDPCAVSWENGRIDVFYRNINNQLAHVVRDNGVWHGPEELGGILSSGPSATQYFFKKSNQTHYRIDVFVRGRDHTIYKRTFKCDKSYNNYPPPLLSSGDWTKDTGFESIGGYSTSDPAATLIMEVGSGMPQIMVFYRGLDKAIWYCTCMIKSDVDTWNPWSLLSENSDDGRNTPSELKNDGWYKLLVEKRNWVGAFAWHLSNTVYCFWEESNKIYGLPMAADRVSYPDTFEFETTRNLQLAPHCGSYLSNQYIKCVGGMQVTPERSINAIVVGATNGNLKIASTLKLSPVFNGPYNLSPPYSPTTFSNRKATIFKAYTDNARAEAQVKTYLEEAFYSVPVLLGLGLRYHQQYQTALDWFRSVYNYVAPIKERKIFYGLEQEERLPLDYNRADDWLADPLDPHYLARQRRYSYTRFTLFCIIQCLLDYADAEFTTDTAETIPKARAMYLNVLDLFNAPEITKKLSRCPDVIGSLTIDVDDPGSKKAWQRISREIANIGTVEGIDTLVERIQKEILSQDKDVYDQISQASRIIHEAKLNRLIRPLVPEKLRSGGKSKALVKEWFDELVADDGVAESLRKAGETQVIKGYVPEPKFQFCIPPNPVSDFYRAHAENDLDKLRTCRNIAGMQREVDPYAAATDTDTGLPQIGAGGQLVLSGIMAVRPTQYRYRTLIERAKQLVNIAQQMEAAFLSALEKRDAEFYSQLRARQDLRIANASLKLQRMRVTEAGHEFELAQLQKQRAEIQVDHFNRLISQGISGFEWASLALLETSVGFQMAAAALHYKAAEIQAALSLVGALQGAPSGMSALLGAISSAAAASSTFAGALSTQSAIISTIASYERRAQDWKFQKKLAEKDVFIGAQHIILAKDKKNIVNGEQQIAQLQADNANDVVEFLTNKFTSAELYEWMSGVMENVYRFFLQQATCTAKLAENQLAFERQETPFSLIQSDYWIVPEDGGVNLSSDENSTDRRGMTGSARLLKDIYQLDQHAFETDRRKLQLTKTISLARMDPLAFQQFRETGTMIFDTSMAMFDRDFPGHYLRLIKRVRTSVIALTPTTEGIRATLTSLGISRVVIGGDVFQEVVVQRDPESVALTSPLNATGLFDLQEDPDKLFPFEATGVDTRWEFSMPKASNPFDFKTIADVLVTIEYTALNSYDYRQQVIQRLDRYVSFDRPYSLRQHFVDQWYALNNPKSKNERVSISFSTRREDFPPNMDTLQVQHATLYIATNNGEPFDHEVTLLFKAHNATPPLGGASKPVENIISTRKGNAGCWSALIGVAPIGTWELSLPNEVTLRDCLKSGDIEDILFVITCEGQTPAYVT